MKLNSDNNWFRRFRRVLRGDFVFRKLTVEELSRHLLEVRANSMQSQSTTEILGHPVDVAEEFNRITRVRRTTVKAIIITPALVGLTLSLFMLAPFQWWRMPFGDFSSLSLGDVNWVSGSLRGSLNGYSTEDNLIACRGDLGSDYGFLERFGIPEPWIRKLDHCNDDNLKRIPSAVREKFIYAVSQSERFRGRYFTFLFSCPTESECIESDVQFNVFDESIIDRAKRDKGRFGLVNIEIGRGRTPKHYAKLSGETIDSNGRSELRYEADGLSDWDGIWAEALVGAIGVGISIILMACYHSFRIAYFMFSSYRLGLGTGLSRAMPSE